MGIYVEPKQDKFEWLLEMSNQYNGLQAFGLVKPDEFVLTKEKVIVCAINNGPFLAIGVCDTETEMEDFAHSDGRQKLWFVLPYSEIRPLIDSAYQKHIDSLLE